MSQLAVLSGFPIARNSLIQQESSSESCTMSGTRRRLCIKASKAIPHVSLFFFIRVLYTSNSLLVTPPEPSLIGKTPYQSLTSKQILRSGLRYGQHKKKALLCQVSKMARSHQQIRLGGTPAPSTRWAKARIPLQRLLCSLWQPNDTIASH